MLGSMRFVGMTLPGKQPSPPVRMLQVPERCGSRMKISRPCGSRVCEKSPRRSSSVGSAVEPHAARAAAPAALRASRRRTASCSSLLVEQPGSLTGPAEVEAVGVEVVLRLLDVRRACSPRRVAFQASRRAVPVGAAAVVGAAALADDLDVRAAAAAELGLVGVEQHFDFGDGVEVDGRRNRGRAR